jgi:hypothetical protein
MRVTSLNASRIPASPALRQKNGWRSWQIHPAITLAGTDNNVWDNF